MAKNRIRYTFRKENRFTDTVVSLILAAVSAFLLFGTVFLALSARRDGPAILGAAGLAGMLQGILGSAADRLSNSQLTEILNNFDMNDLLGGDSEVINEVLELIGANQPTKSNSGDSDDDNSGNSGNQSSSTNNVPQYTNVYMTEAPAATYAYTPGATSPYVTTTVPGQTTTGVGETTTLYYVAPSTIYAEQITTLPYDYQVDATEEAAKDGVTVKMIIGVAILLISGVAVVGVALSLKKSKV